MLSLEMFFEEIEAAPDLQHLVVGIYERAIPAVTDALQRLIADTNKLFDHPTFAFAD